MSEPDTTGGKVVLCLVDPSRRLTLQQWQFELDAVITIGRSPDRDIVIPDAHISRLHVVLQNRDGEWWLTSIGQNGVQVEGQTVDEYLLSDGCAFRLGKQGPVIEFFEISTPLVGVANTAVDFQLEDGQQIQLDQQKLDEDVREIVDADFFQNLLARAGEFRRKSADR